VKIGSDTLLTVQSVKQLW